MTLTATAPSAWMPRVRQSVSAMFLLNGYIVGSWAPKIPEFKTRLGIDEQTLGLLILVFGIGSLLIMPLVGAIIAREGSRRILRLTSLIVTPVLLVLTLVPNLATAAIAIFLFGGFIGGMDVAMNANTVSVERHMRRAIMSFCHGFWSLGGLIGAATGGVLIATLGPLGHAIVVTAVCVAILAFAAPGLLGDTPELAPAEPGAARGPRLPRSLAAWLVGLMALMCMIPEGSVLDWGALFLRDELGASVALSGLGFGAFSATMAVMRFTGDPIRDRLGAVRTLRISALIAATGLLIAGFAPNPGLAILGFAISGLGIANLVPIAFSAAGNLPGLPPGIGISLVSFLGYSGMLFAPSLIGFIAAHLSLAIVFSAMPLMFLAVLSLSHHAVHADVTRPAD